MNTLSASLSKVLQPLRTLQPLLDQLVPTKATNPSLSPRAAELLQQDQQISRLFWLVSAGFLGSLLFAVAPY